MPKLGRDEWMGVLGNCILIKAKSSTPSVSVGFWPGYIIEVHGFYPWFRHGGHSIEKFDPCRGLELNYNVVKTNDYEVVESFKYLVDPDSYRG